MKGNWAAAIKECDTLEKFNYLALSLARERRRSNSHDGFAKEVALEAKRRRYTYIGDRETGSYVEVTPEEYTAVMKELDYREHRESWKRLHKRAKKTKIEGVLAAWEIWVYRQTAAENVGALLVLDFRKRVNNKTIYEMDMVPQSLYERLFQNGAKEVLDNIYRMFGSQTDTETRNWKDAI